MTMYKGKNITTTETLYKRLRRNNHSEEISHLLVEIHKALNDILNNRLLTSDGKKEAEKAMRLIQKQGIENNMASNSRHDPIREPIYVQLMLNNSKEQIAKKLSDVHEFLCKFTDNWALDNLDVDLPWEDIEKINKIIEEIDLNKADRNN